MAPGLLLYSDLNNVTVFIECYHVKESVCFLRFFQNARSCKVSKYFKETVIETGVTLTVWFTGYRRYENEEDKLFP